MKYHISFVRSIFCAVYILYLITSCDVNGTLNKNDIAENTEIKTEELSDVPVEILKEVLADKDFGEEKQVWSLRFKDDNADDELKYSMTPEWIKKIRQIAAVILRAILVAVLAALIFILILFVLKLKNNVHFLEKNKPEQFYSNAHESVEQLLEKAISFWEQGLQRQAWAACFSASIRALEQNGIQLPNNATELEYLALLKKINSPYENEFSHLVKNRICTAYSEDHSLIAKNDFDASVDFCKTIEAARVTS
ncbi:MAG: hypothetical protein Ta2F_07870 [Termitinemataceae bacterium]|nr:MAG: hypothetical protein Ta2F_07870 [Termitinemataceae bacterium]